MKKEGAGSQVKRILTLLSFFMSNGMAKSVIELLGEDSLQDEYGGASLKTVQRDLKVLADLEFLEVSPFSGFLRKGYYRINNKEFNDPEEGKFYHDRIALLEKIIKKTITPGMVEALLASQEIFKYFEDTEFYENLKD